MSTVVLRRAVPGRPQGARRTFPAGWWGMAMAIVTEAMLFAGLLSAWYFTWATSDEWPQGGIAEPELRRTSLFTVVLLGSTIPMVLAERAARRGDVPALRRWLAVTSFLGLVFIGNQALEYTELTFGPKDNAYGSLFFVITGLHGLHVIAGLLMLTVAQVKAWTGRITEAHHGAVRLPALYWHFVDAVWVAVFSSLYLAVAWS